MATVITSSLVAVVSYLPGKGRLKHATQITIKASGVHVSEDGNQDVVAQKTVGGRYSQTDALKEFTRNSKSFVKGEAWPIYAAGLVR
jgi:hypothetical protein